MLAGDREAAREVLGLGRDAQRRAVRIAYHYLRDAYDADEAVQDAFVKVFTHITTYRRTSRSKYGSPHPRERLSRHRQGAHAPPAVGDAGGRAGRRGRPGSVAPQPGPEARLMSSERARKIAAAIEQLPDRQRAVFTLCHIAEQSTSEVSAALGVSEATVRVHLFRAIRRLRKLLASPAREVA